MGNRCCGAVDKLSDSSDEFTKASRSAAINYTDSNKGGKSLGIFKGVLILNVVKYALFAILMGVYITELSSGSKIGYYGAPLMYVVIFSIAPAAELIDRILSAVNDLRYWWMELITTPVRVGVLITLLVAHVYIYVDPEADVYWHTNSEDFRKIVIFCGITTVMSIFALNPFHLIAPINLKENLDSPRNAIMTTIWSWSIIIDFAVVLTLFVFDIINVATVGNDFIVTPIVFMVLNAVRVTLTIIQLIGAFMERGYFPLVLSLIMVLFGTSLFVAVYAMFVQNGSSDKFWTNASLVRTIMEWVSGNWNLMTLVNYITRIAYWGITLKRIGNDGYQRVSSGDK